jgi:hypothetical protein
MPGIILTNSMGYAIQNEKLNMNGISMNHCVVPYYAKCTEA